MSDPNEIGGNSVEATPLEHLAHEFHNLLSVILGELDFLRDSVAELGEHASKDRLLECVRNVQLAARRAATLAKPLVELAKKATAATDGVEPSSDGVEEWDQRPTASGLAEQTPTRLRERPAAAAPAADNDEAGPRRTPSRGGAAAVGTGPQLQAVNPTILTILLVEDVESERRSVARLLEQLGYRVVAVPDGREAVRVFLEEKPIALVLLDLVIPGLSGRDTFRSLRKLDPKVKVLLVSGYVDETRAEELLAEGAEGFLQKPMTLDMLRRAVAIATGVCPAEKTGPG